MNFFQRIEDNINSYQSKAAVIYRDDIMTYGQLGEKMDAMAIWIKENYGNNNLPIIVYGHKETDMIPIFFACIKAGHPYIPVETALPEERINNILENSEAELVINIAGEPINCASNIFILSNEKKEEIFNQYKGRKPDPSWMVKPNETYYILYTSGSTGKPKGVKITFQCLENFIKWGMELSTTTEKDTLLNQVSYSFDVSVMSFYFALCSGATLFTVDKQMVGDLKELYQYLTKSNISIWNSTPSFGEMCLADSSFKREMLPNLKMMMFCGEVLTNNCVEKLLARFGKIEVINFYGPTEATVAVTALVVDEEMLKISPLPLGYAKPGVDIIIIDEAGHEVNPGDKGEILITGDTVGPGYNNNEGRTKAAFVEYTVNGKKVNGYKTGDIGFKNSEGLVHYSGRKDFQIKLSGFRIELEDIEENMRKVAMIKNVAVVPVYEDEPGKVSYLTAFVTLNEKYDEKEFKTIMRIKNELKEHLPDYMIPRKIVIKELMPVNNNGKIDRKKLMEELG